MRNTYSLEPIAVTGAAGFIGTHLVRALVSAGCSPVLLTRAGTTREPYTESGTELRTYEIDLGDAVSIRNALDRIRPSTIFHLSGTRGRGDTGSPEEACRELNYEATVRLLKGSTEAGVSRIIIAGSAEEYGNQPGPLDESMSTPARSPYGVSKAMATNQALEMYLRDGCPVVVVRPFSVYGPGQPRDMFVAEAIAAALHNVEFQMSRGDQKRDLIFVDDVVRGLISAATAKSVEGRAINLGTGQAHRLKDVARLIWKMTGANAPILIGSRSASDEELYDTWADITVARQLLGWEPRVDLETGLRRTIEYAKERLGSQAKICQVM